MENREHKRRELTGVVISDKMQKSIVVKVVRLAKHSKYHKVVKRFKKFHAHDNENVAKVGDTVLIAETRPLSKLKRWRLVKVLRQVN